MKRLRVWFGKYLNLRNVLLAGLTLGVWVLCLILVVEANLVKKLSEVGDLSSLLFGAASLALIAYSVINVIIAVFGWGSIVDAVNRVAERKAEEIVEPLKNESRGRVLTAIGHLIGEMSIDPDSLVPKSRERLGDAVHHCQQAYDVLKRVGGAPEFMGLNNLHCCPRTPGAIREAGLAEGFWMPASGFRS